MALAPVQSFVNEAEGEAVADDNYGDSTWLRSQADRDRILKDGDEIINLVINMVTSGVM